MKNYLDREIIEKEILPNIEFNGEILGSYVRGKNKLGDIDILTKEDIKINLPHEITTNGDKIKRYVITEYNFQIDVYYYKEDYEYIPMINFLNGNNIFNIVLRSVAKRKGFKLSQYSFEKENIINLKSENELFEMLGYKIIPLEKRDVKNFNAGMKLLKAFKI